jgi:hypothetical protein
MSQSPVLTSLGVSDRTRIEYFNGTQILHRVGTFDFLHRFLNWGGAKPVGRIDWVGKTKTAHAKSQRIAKLF